MTEAPDAGPDPGANHQTLIDRRRRRMIWGVRLLAVFGLSACVGVLLLSKNLEVYREHYQFRKHVKPGVGEQEIRRRFDAPYRVYWVRSAVEAVFAGRGLYRSFDGGISGPQDLPAQFEKALLYQTTHKHGEFVFLDKSGRVLKVVTGRRKD